MGVLEIPDIFWGVNGRCWVRAYVCGKNRVPPPPPLGFNPTTPVREVPYACGSYKPLKTSTSSLFTHVLSVTGIDCLSLLPVSGLSRNLGKASQVCLPSSCDPTRFRHLYIVLTGDLEHFTCFIGHRSFYTG